MKAISKVPFDPPPLKSFSRPNGLTKSDFLHYLRQLTFDLTDYSEFFSQKLPGLLTTTILINTNWFAAEMKCKTQKFALKNGKSRDIPYDLYWLTFDPTDSFEI